jgi:adenylate cyclase
MPRMVLELLTSWGASCGYGPAKEVWRLVPLCLMWCIWRERNARHFEDVETSMVELRKSVLNKLYIWIASHHSLNVFTYAEFLSLFSVCSF